MMWCHAVIEWVPIVCVLSFFGDYPLKILFDSDIFVKKINIIILKNGWNLLGLCLLVVFFSFFWILSIGNKSCLINGLILLLLLSLIMF